MLDLWDSDDVEDTNMDVLVSVCLRFVLRKLGKTSLAVLNEALEKTRNRINRFYRGKGEGRGRGGELSDSDENMT